MCSYYADVYYPYQGSPPNPGSIHSYNLATKVESKIIERGYNPVAEDGVLLWSDMEPGYFSAPRKTTVYARMLDRSAEDMVLVSDLGGSSGYSASSDNIVFAFTSFTSSRYGGASLYNIPTRISKVIALDPTSSPMIRDNTVVWTNPPITRGMGQPSTGFSISKYNLDRGASAIIVPESSTEIYARGITEKNQVVYTRGSPAEELYVTDPGYGN